MTDIAVKFDGIIKEDVASPTAQDTHQVNESQKLEIEVNSIKESIYSIFKYCVCDYYANYLYNELKDDILEYIKEATDFFRTCDWNDDDVRYAIGAVLMGRLGLPQ